MSSFFTLPWTQKKRKRNDIESTPARKKIATTGDEISKVSRGKPQRSVRDDSISGSDIDSGDALSKGDQAEGEEVSDSEDVEAETAADRRLKLAERYLENIKGEIEQEVGFDAAEIDRDLIAERLKEDVAEGKGRLYRHIASSFDLEIASRAPFRADTLSTTGIATSLPYAYTVSKDITLIKWELPAPMNTSVAPSDANGDAVKPASNPLSRRPKKLAFVRGTTAEAGNIGYLGHVDQILTVAASQDGKYVATGGRDRRIVVWDASNLSPLKVFTQHRDSVYGLVFRRGTNQLYSCAKDRTIKIWSLNELAYVDTLFGHQDEVVDIAALALERCLSVGARDRTARLWKVVEESQLIFNGGGGEKKKDKLSLGGTKGFREGSMDRVAMIDEETFVTGSDNGSLSLWTTQRKKPLSSISLAHGLEYPIAPEDFSAEMEPQRSIVPQPQPRWITALAAVPYSDLVVSGSWDGYLRIWKVSEDKKKLEATGVLPTPLGVVNDLSMFERGERGMDGLCIVAALGKEMRLGRWIKVKGRNGAVVYEISLAK